MEDDMPDPKKFSDRDSFMQQCMSDTKAEGLEMKQRLGKCFGMWRGAHGGSSKPREEKKK
jgi:hypothetical protein